MTRSASWMTNCIDHSADIETTTTKHELITDSSENYSLTILLLKNEPKSQETSLIIVMYERYEFITSSGILDIDFLYFVLNKVSSIFIHFSPFFCESVHVLI